MRNCPDCDRKMILYGKGATSVLDLKEGRAVRVPVAVQKMFCGKCKTVHADKSATVSAAMMEACVEGVMAVGVAATARRLGCDRSVVGAVFADWEKIVVADLPKDLPDAIGFHSVDFGGVEKILVTDAVEETLIEILDDEDSLSSWLERMPGKPTLALVDVDPTLVSMLERVFPGIEIAIAPSTAAKAVLSAAQTTLKAMVRAGAAKGSNFREDASLLYIADADLSEEQREMLSFWAEGPRAIRRLARDVVDALTARRKDALRKALDDAIAVLGAAVPVGALGRMLTTWRNRILAGLDHVWLDRIALCVEDIGRTMAGASWPLRKAARAFLLFSDPERSIEKLSKVARAKV